MHNQIISWQIPLFVFVFCLAGCTFEAGLKPVASVQPPAATETAYLPTTATAFEAASQTTPVLTPTAQAPYFSRKIDFTTQPGSSSSQRTFAPRTRKVYALWDYANLRDGLIIRREWYLNGALWLVREGPWDFAKYGANGRVTDVSVYDFDQGLPAGHYQLRLYIDGQPQFALETDAAQIEFSIQASIASPDGNYFALIPTPQVLQIEDSQGIVISQFNLNDIEPPVWFPDSIHLVFSDRDHSQQVMPPATAGIRHKLYLANVQTGELQELASLDENLHAAIVAPNGRKLALYKGDNWFDACFVNTELVFMELDAAFRRIRLTSSKDFQGIVRTGESIYPLVMLYPQLTARWLDETRFEAAMGWTCVYENDPSGNYIFDLVTSQAERIGDVVLP